MTEPPSDTHELASPDEPHHEALDPRGVSASAVAAAAGARRTSEALRTADAAATVAQVLAEIAGEGRVPTADRQLGAFLKREAADVRAKSGRTGNQGAVARVRGYVFERMDTETYNATKAVDGKRLEPRSDPRAPAYDATRFIVDPVTGKEKFAGGVQQKASAHSAGVAVAKMNERKPGSASRGTIRVPGDQVEAATRKVDKRARVAGSDVTTAQLDATMKDGLDALAANGAAATSRGRAAAASAGKAGATSAAFGGLTDTSALVRGNMTKTTFAKRRAQEAGEAAVASTVAGAAGRIGAASVGARAVAAGAARSAVVTVVVSSLRDVPAVVRRDLSPRDFAENRAIDAGEAAAATALGGAAGVALLATSGGAAAATAVTGATAAAATTAAAVAAGTGTAAGATLAGILGAVTVTAAGPVIVGGVAVAGSGLAVSVGFSRVRRHVRVGQERRRRELVEASALLLIDAPPDHGLATNDPSNRGSDEAS